MANMDVSLDDLIQKKFSKFPQRGRGGLKRIGVSAAGNLRQNTKSNINLNRRVGGFQQRNSVQQRHGGGILGTGGPPVIGDARNKIIQKKRQKLTDARDKLCEIAKKSDARLKLEKMRENRMRRTIPAADYMFNGVTGTASNRKLLPGGIRGGRSHTGLATSVTLQRTINQSPNASRFRPKVPALMDMDIDLNDDFMDTEAPSLCRTVNNDRMRIEPLLRPSKLPLSSPYSWKAPQLQTSSSRGYYIDLDYPAEERKRMKLPSPPPGSKPILLSDDEDVVELSRNSVRPIRALGSTLGSNTRVTADVKSRLDSRTQASSPSSASAHLPGSSGYRIVVSNLQTSVTHEDIRELFEDIGPLLTSRLVRPGTAEVVYCSAKDAERAVDNYHNRQLDGQPMKCLLVKPRHSSTPAPTHSSSSIRLSSGVSLKLQGSGKSSVVPDIGTIHKALFNKS